MDPYILLFPLLFGLIAKRLHLPTLVGYLFAGFALNSYLNAGFPLEISSEHIELFLQHVGKLGITLLLFVIGLKLNVRDLLKKEIWAGASLHVVLNLFFCFIIIKFIAFIILYYLYNSLFDLDSGQIFLISFGLSFSSTVLAINMLDIKGDAQTFYGKTTIGILIMQDIIAVVYLAISNKVLPSPYALLLLFLPLLQPIIYKIFKKVGHKEMLVLFGITMALVPGAALFQQLGIKPELGALVMGTLLAPHPKSRELYEKLFLFKEIFVIAFILSIGQSGIPTFQEFSIALFLILLLLIKFILFVLILTRFHFRVRSAIMTAFALTNYSEFALIILLPAMHAELLSSSWIRIISLAIAMSFILSAPIIKFAESFYVFCKKYLKQFETEQVHPEEQSIDPGAAKVLICGMGRVGSAAYDDFLSSYSNELLGIEHKKEVIERYHKNRNVVLADSTDTDFWDKLAHKNIEMIVLAMPSHDGNLQTTLQIKRIDFKGKITAISRYSDEIEELQSLGVDFVYNFYEVAGIGLAEHVLANANKINY